MTTFNENDIVIDFRDYAFDVDKDSRESISVATQLNVVTDSNKMIFGSKITNVVPYVNSIGGQIRIGYLLQRPKLFDEEIDEENFVEEGWDYKIDVQLKTAEFHVDNESNNKCQQACAGIAMLDADNNLLCFIDKPLKVGDDIPSFFFMFRRNI